MATVLPELYEVLSCFSTATQTSMCNDLLRQLTAKGGDNHAAYFADLLHANQSFSQIERYRSVKNLRTCHVSLGVFSNSREKKQNTSPDFLSSIALFAAWR